MRCLILDRDGVINKRIVDDYVKSWEEFELLPNVLQSLKVIRSYFELVIVVTNQRGVGLGIMSNDELRKIHERMLEELKEVNIAKIYSATSVDRDNFYRKPKIGMKEVILNDFPDLNFSQSLMVGDSTSDIEFGLNLGMITVQLGDCISSKAHFCFLSLKEMSTEIENVIKIIEK